MTPKAWLTTFAYMNPLRFLTALLLLPAALNLTGCGSTAPVVANPNDPMPRYGNGIQIARMDMTKREPTVRVDMFADKSEIQKPYRVIATLFRECNAQDAGRILNAVAWNARQLGADGMFFPPPEKSPKVAVNVQVGQYIFGKDRDGKARIVAHAFVYEPRP